MGFGVKGLGFPHPPLHPLLPRHSPHRPAPCRALCDPCGFRFRVLGFGFRVSGFAWFRVVAHVSRFPRVNYRFIFQVPGFDFEV